MLTCLLLSDFAGFDTSRVSSLESSKRVRLALVSCTPAKLLKARLHQRIVFIMSQFSQRQSDHCLTKGVREHYSERTQAHRVQ